MAFEVFDDATQGAIFVVSIATLPICTLVTLLRFSPSRRRSKKTGLEDWFAFGAWATFVTYVTIVLIIVFLVNGKSFSILTPSQLQYAAKVSSHRRMSSTFAHWIINIAQLVYANSLFYWTNQLFAKLCILLLYRRIFAVNDTYRWSIYSIAIIHVGLIISAVLVALFGCHPIAKGWDPALPGTCITTAPHPFLAGVESINSAVDFAMVILVMFMIRELNMSISNKLKVSILFILGGLAGIIGFVKIGQLYATGGGSKSRAVNFTIGLWTIVQQACSIICCCAPIYKSILPSGDIFSRLASGTSSFWVKTVKSVPTKNSLVSRSERSGKRSINSRSNHNASVKDDWMLLDASSQKRHPSTEYETPFSYNRSVDSTYRMATVHHEHNTHGA